MGQLSGFTYRDIVQRLKFFGFSFLRQAAGKLMSALCQKALNL